MKKSLLALAAMGAFAGAAQAQSSVTVYGILDVGYIGSMNSVTSNGVPAAGSTYYENSGNDMISVRNRIGAASSQSNGFTGVGAETTSRLGFRGTEDLGGGLSGFFTIEVAITPQGEQAISTAGTQNRQTFVGLAKKGIGQFSIGTQYTSIHRAVGLTDPGQQNNIVGNVIYPSPTGTFGVPGNGNTSSYTVRTNNMLYLQSENLSGFQANAFFTQNNTNSNQTTPSGTSYTITSENASGTDTSSTAGGTGYRGGNNNNQAWGVGLNYTWQKLLLTANYQSLNSKNPYGLVTYTPGTNATNNLPNIAVSSNSTPSAWIGSAGGFNVKDNQQYYAATYDFGILKAYVQYINRKATSQINSAEYASRTAQQIGVRGNLSKTIEGWASAGTGRSTSYGSSQPTANFNGWQLGGNYWLSKRTNLYTIYGQTNTSTASFNGVVSSAGVLNSSGTSSLSAKASQYAVGVRHTF